MNLPDFLSALDAAGIRMSVQGDRISFGPKGGTPTPEARAAAAALKGAAIALKSELLAYLTGSGGVTGSGGTVTRSTVTISGKEFAFERPWSGRQLPSADGYLAFDTETAVVDLLREVPALALASASAGEKASCLIHPGQV